MVSATVNPPDPPSPVPVARRMRWSVLTNLASGAYNALLGLIFVPIYLRYLGIEAYGLVGFFVILQGLLALLDLGLGFSLTRSLARLVARRAEAGAIRDTARTFELTFWLLSAMGSGVVAVLARPIAERWIHTEALTASNVVVAVRIMALTGALQLPLSVYRAALLGLDRQPLMNAVFAVFATLRSGGAAVVAFLSGSVIAFFWWNALVAVLFAIASGITVWRTLPPGRAPRARFTLLKSEWKFAAGVFGNSVIGIVLTQSDKMILSGALSLREFGYYTLASTLSIAILTAVITPFNTASFTRFAALFETGEDRALRDLYHTASQFMAVFMMPLALTLIFFSREVLEIWTHNPETASHTSRLLAILLAGTLLNAIASVASYVQSAAGWPQLMMYTNLVVVTLILPAMWFAVRTWGGPGAAGAWVMLNLTYVLVTIPIMHRRILRGEGWKWMWQDVLAPLLTVCVILGIGRLVTAAHSSSIVVRTVMIGISFLVSAMAAVVVLPRVRRTLLPLIHGLRMRWARA